MCMIKMLINSDSEHYGHRHVVYSEKQIMKVRIESDSRR